MRRFLLALVCFFASQNIFAATTNYEKMKSNVIEIVSRMVEARTVYGDESKAAKIIAAYVCKGRIKCDTVGSAPREGLIARLPATADQKSRKKPFLVMAHLDVVAADAQWEQREANDDKKTWTMNPHTPTLKDGFLYGRGVLDDLSYGVITAEVMLELMNSNTPMNRDIILAFLPDEEKGGHQGVELVINNKKWRDLIADAEFALNEGGMNMEDANGNPVVFRLAVAEKLYVDLELSIQNVPGGPSWMAQPQKALVYLSRAIKRLDEMDRSFPVQLSDLTREQLRRMAPTRPEPDMRAAMLAVANSKGTPPADAVAKVTSDAGYNAFLKTTCVPTTVTFKTSIGTNILPTQAMVNINCRVLPGMTKEQLRDKAIEFLTKNTQDADLKSFIEKKDPKGITMTLEFGAATGEDSPISPLQNEVIDTIASISAKYYNNTLVLPALLTAASDSRYTRKYLNLPTYGVGTVFFLPADVSRVHGVGERISLDGTKRGIEFFHLLLLKFEGIDRGPASVVEKEKPLDKALREALSVNFGH